VRDRAEVKAELRATLGALARTATGEVGMLARALDHGEPIVAAVLYGERAGARGLLEGGRAVVATPRRLLFVSKAPLSRRERFREVALDEVAAVTRREALGLDLRLHDGEVIALHVPAPAGQVGRLLDHVRTAQGAPPPDREHLEALARRKLGRLNRFAVEEHVGRLAEALGPDEAVLDLAAALGRPGGLLALTTDRLLVVPGVRFGAGPPEEVPADGEARLDGDDLVIGERRFAGVVPVERAEALVLRLQGRRRR
jgi:hypothetical protein